MLSKFARHFVIISFIFVIFNLQGIETNTFHRRCQRKEFYKSQLRENHQIPKKHSNRSWESFTFSYNEETFRITFPKHPSIELHPNYTEIYAFDSLGPFYMVEIDYFDDNPLEKKDLIFECYKRMYAKEDFQYRCEEGEYMGYPCLDLHFGAYDEYFDEEDHDKVKVIITERNVYELETFYTLGEEEKHEAFIHSFHLINP